MIFRDREARYNLTVPPGAHTLEGFRAWVNSGSFPETGNITLVQGELLIDMNAERLESHNQVKTEITVVVARLVKELDFEFTIFLREAANFVAAASDGGWQMSPVFGKQFRFDRKRNRRGGWSYTLHMR